MNYCNEEPKPSSRINIAIGKYCLHTTKNKDEHAILHQFYVYPNNLHVPLVIAACLQAKM